MDIKPIKTKADFRAALKEIDKLMTAEAGTPEGERLDMLARLVEAYERRQIAVSAQNLVSAERSSNRGSDPKTRSGNSRR
jgi:HTH-type transcriptional regulator/antitoxin HigA